MKIGETIAKTRKEKGIKQKDFAKQIGISQEYLSKVEKGRRIASIPILQKIATALQIPLPILFFLGISEKDMPEHKKELFKQINPFIHQLTKQLYE